ncbi:hypothetical protein GCM10010222_13610 [Streptomyces tanashiensis]|nr:hypothetical protein GCM10010222_13610 [Streptomyces tanashiensis]
MRILVSGAGIAGSVLPEVFERVRTPKWASAAPPACTAPGTQAGNLVWPAHRTLGSREFNEMLTAEGRAP